MNYTAIQQSLILIGGGHAHLQVLKQLATKPLLGLQVTLISREIEMAYSGMLPGYISGHYSWEDVHLDLVPLCARAGVNFIHDEVIGLDIPNHAVQLAKRPDMRFDTLSINVGSSSNLLIGKEKENNISVRPIQNFLARLEALLAYRRQSSDTNIVVVGSGAGGIEVAFAVLHRLRNEGLDDDFKIRIVSASASCLAGHHPNAQSAVLAQIKRQGIEWMPEFKVKSVRDKQMQAEDGRQIDCTHVIWATGPTAQPWIAQSGLPVDDQGFILVDEHLACVGVPWIFAAGDTATMVGSFIPKAGVFAVRQGQVLHRNLYRKLLGQPLLEFKPQAQFLSILALGKKAALANRGRFCLRGGWVWHWKSWLDRRFVEKFRPQGSLGTAIMQGADRAVTLIRGAGKQMPVRQEMTAMHCGGCASKLSSDILGRVLNRLGLAKDSDDSPGDDAAILDVPDGCMVQSFDGFRAMLPDAYLMGRIAALHALNDIHAMGACPLYALASVTLPWAKSEIMEDQLFQTLAGALATFKEEQTVLVGGHSGEGPEMHLGFAVTGSQEKGLLWRKSGMGIEDALILTKPVGAGILFAAHAQALCSGRWWLAAVAELIRSNQAAVSVLKRHNISACTDVTGFGLLGHAVEMAQASGCQLAVGVLDVPVLEGSIACFARGLESSLQQANEQVLKEVSLTGFGRSDPRVRVLMDPMTSGGLLASLPASEVQPCLAELQAAGYEASCIGQVIKNEGATIQLLPHCTR